jgi:hypothetical protein
MEALPLEGVITHLEIKAILLTQLGDERFGAAQRPTNTPALWR